MNDRTILLLSAIIVGGGLVYLAVSIGDLTATASRVTDSPLAGLLTSLGGTR